MKKVGQIVELDPEKKYVMLINQGIMSEEDLQVLALHMQKQEGSFLTIQLPNFESIQFVENSDKIVDVQVVEPKQND